jgi:hypothetical protein
MTHSHDRTLLASLGFSDPDKREPLHDLACEYLTEPAQADRLARLVFPDEIIPGTETHTEVVISKGEGQYRSMIGFLDVRIDWFSGHPVKWQVRGSVFVEVKIQRVSVGDIIRQIKLYREYAHVVEARDASEARNGETRSAWVLATRFPLDAGETQLLDSAGITHVRLLEGYEKWFQERLKRPAPKPEEF